MKDPIVFTAPMHGCSSDIEDKGLLFSLSTGTFQQVVVALPGGVDQPDGQLMIASVHFQAQLPNIQREWKCLHECPISSPASAVHPQRYAVAMHFH